MAHRVSTQDCVTCPVIDRSLWCQLTAPDFASLNRSKSTRTYSAGETLYRQGDDCRGVYCIESGLVGSRKYDTDGNSTLVRLHGPGEAIGYRALLTNNQHQVDAEVLMPSRVCRIEHDVVRKLVATTPALGLQFLQISIAGVTDAEDRYVRSVTHTARARVLHLLVVLYRRFGEAMPNGGCILELPLARQDLAALAGITAETLSRTLRRLEKERVVHFEGRRVSFADIDALFDDIELTDR